MQRDTLCKSKITSEDSSILTRNSYSIERYFRWFGNTVGTQKWYRDVTSALSTTLLERCSQWGTSKTSGFAAQTSDNSTFDNPSSCMLNVWRQVPHRQFWRLAALLDPGVATTSRKLPPGLISLVSGILSTLPVVLLKSWISRRYLKIIASRKMEFLRSQYQTIWVARKWKGVRLALMQFEILKSGENWLNCGPICGER